MRILVLFLALLAGCSGADDIDQVKGALERACHLVADRYCCASSNFTECHRQIKFEACYGPVGSAPEAGCMNGGLCIRSSVDFAACNRALDDSPGDICEVACDVGDGEPNEPGCFPLPAECRSIECPTPAEGCAEDPEPWSGVP